MAEEVQTSESEKKKEDWMNSKWRPMMGWMYMLVCTMDFVGFPILWSLLQAMSKGAVNVQWQPLTLQGAGLFHIAMGAVIGISAYGRTQEKLGGANNGGLNLPANTGTTYTPPAPISGTGGGFTSTPPAVSGSGGFGSAPSSGFGATPPGSSGASSFGGSGFGSTPPTATPGFSSGFGSTPAPATTASGKKIVPDDPNAFPLQ
jgi:hypothetical protein